MSEHIKQNIITYLLISLIGLVGLIVLGIYTDLYPLLILKVIKELQPKTILSILGLLFVLLLTSFVLNLILYFKNKNKLIPKFGVLWDRKFNAYCPYCESYLTNYTTHVDMGIFRCLEHKEIMLKLENDTGITYEKAIPLLKELFK